MKARKKKRILSLLLAAVLSFGILPLNVSASESASLASIEEMQIYITDERLENPQPSAHRVKGSTIITSQR